MSARLFQTCQICFNVCKFVIFQDHLYNIQCLCFSCSYYFIDVVYVIVIVFIFLVAVFVAVVVALFNKIIIKNYSLNISNYIFS